jgi:hypothetical protein
MDISRALDASIQENEPILSPESSVPPIQYEEKDEEDIKEEMNDNWSRDDNDVPAPRFHSFTGLTDASSIAQSPLEFLQLFLSYQLIQQFTQYTNDYAHHYSNDVEWSTTPEELYCFIGVHIYMGICDLPQWHMYWSKEYQQPFVAHAFSQHRFEHLLKYFQVTQYVPPVHPIDPLLRVRSFITILNQLFPQCYAPSQYLTIDEAMVAFKGRSSIKQYIPSKPHKWGYKIYCLASDNYLLHLEIYEGKDMHPSPEGPVHDLVMRMIAPYSHKGFILFTDQWFTSPTLLSSLHNVGIRLCGSVGRKRRGLPRIDDADIKNMSRGDVIKRTNDDMALAVWKDQKALFLLFNHVSSSHLNSLNRWSESGHKISLPCPQAIHDYFFHARSVDVIGQLYYSYRIGRKSKRSYSRLVWWCIDMCIINAYILYKVHHPNITQLQFREQLMHELVDLFRFNRNAIQVSRGANVSVALAKDHYSILVENDRDCFVCSNQSTVRKRTNYFCIGCNKHMCLGDCFRHHHA